MKLYIITERGYEYNDYTYDWRDDGGRAIKAYKSLENAQAECDRLTAEVRKQDIVIEGDSNPQFFTVQTVEVADHDIVGYSERRKAIEEQKKASADSARKELRRLLDEAFAAYPKLQAVRWTQYTPYFNDGDPCTFNVHDSYVKFDDTPEDGGDYGDGFEYYYGDENPEKYAAAKAVRLALGTISEDDMLAVFGDHAKITATRDGFTCDDHGHD